jgi:hypothetical protein
MICGLIHVIMRRYIHRSGPKPNRRTPCHNIHMLRAEAKSWSFGAHLRRINADISARRGAIPSASHRSTTAPTSGRFQGRIRAQGSWMEYYNQWSRWKIALHMIIVITTFKIYSQLQKNHHHCKQENKRLYRSLLLDVQVYLSTYRNLGVRRKHCELLIAGLVPGKRHHARITHVCPYHHAAPLIWSLPGERGVAPKFNKYTTTSIRTVNSVDD